MTDPLIPIKMAILLSSNAVQQQSMDETAQHRTKTGKDLNRVGFISNITLYHFTVVLRTISKPGGESIMKATDTNEAELLIQNCPMNERTWGVQYLWLKSAFAIMSIILNAISCPFTIVLNVMVIVAVKTRPRLQTKYNILLACLAATDLLVGVAAQPHFIAFQAQVIKGLSLTQYCNNFRMTFFVSFIPILVSLFHLSLLSIERVVAMKYTLRYTTVVTTRKLTVAVIIAWVIATLPAILYSIAEELETVIRVSGVSFVFLNVLVIMFCHISVYFVTRRHEKQIASEQVSQEAAANFAKEKKALKTTKIIVMALVFSYFPSIVFFIIVHVFSQSWNHAVNVIILSQPLWNSCLLANSLCNPVIYCYRSNTFRRAFKQMLKMSSTNIDLNDGLELH